MSKITKEQAAKAANKIRKYCGQHPGACTSKCLFYEKSPETGDMCQLNNACNPQSWRKYGRKRKSWRKQ